MSLDNTRNRTLQTNLTISIGSLALTTATLPAAIFGMNLHSGWEARCQVAANSMRLLLSASYGYPSPLTVVLVRYLSLTQAPQ